MNTGHGQKKSRKREIAIACLLAFPTVKAAAKAAGIAEVTLHRWLKDPDFFSAFQRARERTLELAGEQLRRGTLAAVLTLQEIASNRRAPCASRVQAARSFLECCGLLKGVGVAVTVNNTIPSTLEELDTALVKQLSAILSADAQFRQTIHGIIEGLEMGDDEKRHLLN